MDEKPKEQDPKSPRRGWSKAARRRAATRRRRLPGDWSGGDGHTDPPARGTPCGTCGLRGGCDCR